MQNGDELKRATKKTKTTLSSRPKISMLKLMEHGIKSEEHFTESFAHLCKHWWDRESAVSDTEGGMLVTSTLGSHINDPIILAIIADDVEVFTKHFKEHQGKAVFYFEFCCLCGAEQIIQNVFLSDEKMKHCLVISKNAIGYALSSGKVDFASSLASEAQKLGKTDPGVIMLYSFGKHKDARKIKSMFSVPDGEQQVSAINCKGFQDPAF